jgi:hypothetical protein
MSSLTIPATMSDVTPEWLTAALRKGGTLKHAAVTSIERETIGVGVGILGKLARLSLTYDRPELAAPASLVAKLPTTDPGGRGIGTALGFYNKEVLFYQHLGRDANLPSPRCYWSAADPAVGQFCLLLEDLSKVRIGDQVDGATLEDARLILKIAARFHAYWWNHPRLQGLHWIPAVNAPVYRFVPVAYQGALEPFLNSIGQRLNARQQSVARELGSLLPVLQDSMADAPATLLHGDLRLDNVFYGSTDGTAPVTLIDWQIASQGVGIYDIGYFMTQSLDPALRSAHERALVEEYFSRLRDGGVNGYSWEQCWDDYRKVALYCLVYPVISIGTIDLANERGVTLAEKMTDRCIAAIDDLGAEEFLKQLVR